jgi:hypothetical protein
VIARVTMLAAVDPPAVTWKPVMNVVLPVVPARVAVAVAAATSPLLALITPTCGACGRYCALAFSASNGMTATHIAATRPIPRMANGKKRFMVLSFFLRSQWSVVSCPWQIQLTTDN